MVVPDVAPVIVTWEADVSRTTCASIMRLGRQPGMLQANEHPNEDSAELRTDFSAATNSTLADGQGTYQTEGRMEDASTVPRKMWRLKCSVP
jgi:hypothetical protein